MTRWLRFLTVPVLALAVAVFLVWAAFRWLIVDPRLVLDYVRALAWPAVAGLLLVLIRKPLVSKVASILRVEFLGTLWQFADTQPLDDAIRPSVNNLIAPATEGDRVEIDASGPAKENDVASHASVDGSGSDPRGTVSSYHEPGDRAATPTRDKDSQRRQSVESIVRAAADWGYQLGKSGAPKRVPDIEWNPDGTWDITTEIPPRQAMLSVQSRLMAAQGVNPMRAVQRLEQEIIETERRIRSPMASVGVSALGEKPWLDELKRRLRALDPGNPFAGSW